MLCAVGSLGVRCSQCSSVWMLPMLEKQRAAWHSLQLLPAVPTACITGALSGSS